MKTTTKLACAALALALGSAAYAEEYVLLKAKVELLVEQAKDFYDESCRKGSELYGAQYKYYFGLMYATGTNALGRAETPANKRKMEKYYELIEKDYAAYTSAAAAYDKVTATGSDKVHVGRHVVKDGSRHRAKRIINAEKLGDKQLEAAIKRWEEFAVRLKKEAK